MFDEIMKFGAFCTLYVASAVKGTLYAKSYTFGGNLTLFGHQHYTFQWWGVGRSGFGTVLPLIYRS